MWEEKKKKGEDEEEEEVVRIRWVGVASLRLHIKFWLHRDAGDARTFRVT